MADTLVKVVESHTVVTPYGSSALQAWLDQTSAEAVAAASSAAAAAVSATEAEASAAAAAVALSQTAIAGTYETKADATAALGSIAADDFVQVLTDESQGDRHTLYQKSGGVLVLKKDFSEIRGLLAPGDPHLGRGDPIGAPSGTLTLADAGAGALTGTYRYAYAESDGTGITPISAYTAITVSAKQVLITVPQPRRGTSGRRIYRTKAGDTSRYYLLKAFNGGENYFQSEFLDNVADGSLGAERTDLTTDTTELWAVELNDSVKFFRTHPDQGANPADLTILTGDSGYTTGAYALDVYGEYLGRTRLGNTFGSEKAGDQGAHFLFSYLGPRVDVDTPTTVARMMPRGSLILTRSGALTDPSAADGNASVLSATAAFGTSNTATAAAVDFAITGAGSATYQQIAARFSLGAGYTGSEKTVGVQGNNSSAHSGLSVGLGGFAQGAAAFSLGVNGQATAGTKKVGGFFSNDLFDPTTLVWAGGISGAALAASNATTVNDIVGFFDNTTNVFRIENGGAVTSKNVGATGLFDITNSSGGGNLRLEANGGNYVGIGSSNNVEARFRANGNTCFTATIRQTLNLPSISDPASPQDGDIWRNGNDLKVCLGGVAKTITVS